MDKYRKKIDEMHAPEELITATLNKIHEEEKLQSATNSSDTDISKKIVAGQRNIQTVRKRNRWIGVSSLATVAAAVVIVIGLSGRSNPQMNLVYNTVPESIVRIATGEQTEDTMDIAEYSNYLGLDIQNLMDNATLIKSEIRVIYEGETVKEEEGTAYYNVNGEQMMIRFSKTVNTIPENLEAGEISEVNGQTILAGVSENGKERMAAFERNGITCFLISYSMEQQEFEEFLSGFLKNFEK